MIPSNFRYPYYYPVKVKEVNDIPELQREIVQKVIRTNSRWKLAKILEFVRRTLEE